jgi:hypothetical protein
MGLEGYSFAISGSTENGGLNSCSTKGDAGTYPSHQRRCAATAAQSGEMKGDASPRSLFNRKKKHNDKLSSTKGDAGTYPSRQRWFLPVLPTTLARLLLRSQAERKALRS